MAPVRLMLLGKPHCSLCDAAREVVEDVIDELDGRLSFQFTELDVNADPDVKARYRHDIPVLRIDGIDAFRHRIEHERLLARLLHGTPAPLETTQDRP